MPARSDATGTPSSRWIFLLIGAVVLTPAGCLGLGKKPATRGSPEPSMPQSPTSDRPLEITPPPPPAPGGVPAKPTGLAKEDTELSPLKRLAMKAVESERSLNNYMVRIRRREQIDGRDQPEEIILLKFRRAPLSVHCKWLGDESHGREILYVQGQNDNKIVLLTGKGDLFGAGKKMKFSVDSPLVRSKSHYPVTEAGIGAANLRFAALIEAIERGQSNAGTARHLGLQNRPEFPRPVEGVEQKLPPGLEVFLPKGGTRFFYFDESTGLPCVVVTFDTTGHEVEYYHFDRIQTPVNLDDNDFNPEALWGK